MPGTEWKKSLKNPKQYEALRKKGEPKEKAARISNSAAAAAEDLELTLVATPYASLRSVGLGHLKMFSDRSSVSDRQYSDISSLRGMSKRREQAKSGVAQSDGSFPIPDVAHLKKAVRAYGRSSNKGKTKRHIIRKARGLGATQHLPESWGVGKSKKGKTNSIVADGRYNGTLVAAYPPPELAAKLAGGNEGDTPPGDMHVTLAYFPDATSPQDVAAVRSAVFDIAHQQPSTLHARATSPGTFDAPEGDNPRIFYVNSPGLSELRDAIVSKSEEYGLEPSTEHDFNPHMTVRYGGEPVTELPDGGDESWPIDALVVKNAGSHDVQPFGHDFLPQDDDPGSFDSDGDDETGEESSSPTDSNYCELCSRPADDDVHGYEPLQPYLDDMQEDGEPTSLGDVQPFDGQGESDGVVSNVEFNWVSDAGGLPKPIDEVRKAIQRGGSKGESHAIAIAVSRAKKWATLSKNIKTRAKYSAAVAQWEAMKAKAHADNVAVASAEADKLLTRSYPFEIEDIELIEPGQWRVSALDLEEGRMTDNAVASSTAWGDGDSYYWNDDTNAVYAVDKPTGKVSQFVGKADTGGEWEPRPEMSLDDVQNFPTVDDPDTLEAITAATETETPDVSPYAGAEFEIAVVIPEGIPSGDTRSFSEGALEFLEPPFPLFWQKTSDEGHNGSVTVGKFTSIERTEAGLGNAKGVFDTHEDAIEAARQVAEGFLLGVSGDVDQFKAEMSMDDGGEEKVDIKHGRLVGATLVGKPAFQECRIKLTSERARENAGAAVAEGDGENAVTASGGPIKPPSEWFRDPHFSAPTRLVVEDNGRVYGHIAAWGTKHTGNSSLTPPRSNTNYKFFKSGTVKTEDGFDVSVGHLTLAGGHAGLNLSADRAVQHYDDTKSAVADVACGEDDFGIWVAGSVRPGVSDEQVYAFRASSPSGDWRRLDNNLELVAVCQVNTPGFPVPRAAVASGEQLALVAAGVLAPELTAGRFPTESEFAELSDLRTRVGELETFVRSYREAQVQDRVEAQRAALSVLDHIQR